MKDIGRYTGCTRNTLTLRARVEEVFISTVASIVKPIYKNRKKIIMDIAMLALFYLVVYVIYINVETSPKWSIFMSLLTGGLALHYIEKKEV